MLLSRTLTVSWMAGVVALVIAPPTTAGTFDVLACGAAGPAAGFANNAWTPSNDAPTSLRTVVSCAATMTTPDEGINAADVIGGPNTSVGASAMWRLTAPAGGRVVHLRSWHSLGERTDDSWLPFLRTGEGGLLATCDIGSQSSCEVGPGGYGGGELPLEVDLNTAALEIGVRCDSAPSVCINGGFLHDAWAALYAAIVTIEDTTAPSMSTPTGALWSDAWQRGMAAVSVTGTDTAIGIKESRLTVDGQQRTSVSNGACDYTYVDPCKRPSADFVSSPALNTTQVADGTHELKVSVVDAANNEASETRTIRVDNTAPGAPQTTLQGPAWRSANDFDVSWSNGDGQVSPIVRARYRLCREGGTMECSVGDRQGDVSTLSDLAVAADGVWELRIARDDEAGNEGGFPLGPSAVLRLDRSAPAAPQGLAPVTKRQTSNGFGVKWTNPGGQLAPIVAATYHVCPVPPGACGASTRVAGPNIQAISGINVPRVGTWRVEVRLEDEAGNSDGTAIAATDVELAGGPTPTPTPDGRRANPRLTVSAKPSKDRRRLRITGRIDSRATGRVRLLVRVGSRRYNRTARQRQGRYALTVRLPRTTKATKVRVSANYGGDARLTAASKRVTAALRRRA